MQRREYTRQQVLENLIPLVATSTGLDEKSSKVVPQANMILDLGADSLDVIDLTMLIEEHFMIELPDAIGEKIPVNTIAWLADQIYQVLQKEMT